MSVPNQALNHLIEHLKHISRYNPHLIADVKENTDKLQLELEFLKSMMRDFSKFDSGSSYLMQTMKGIRSVIDDAEDAVDAYVVLAAAAQKSKAWVRALQPNKELRDAGKIIADMAQRVKQINEEKIRTGAEVLQLQSITQVHISAGLPAETKAPTVEGALVTGLEDPEKCVQKLLTEGPENLEVITIAGMSGLGKSTLAKMVYNDPGVSNKFMIRAFVNVSKQFNKKDVLLQLSTSVPGINDEAKEMQEVELEKHVFEQLKGKQYLIVLDDVWENDDWDSLKGAFPDNNNNKRCRVLITTTNAGLAEHANPGNSDSLYLLESLTAEDSKELLRCKVFGKDHDFPDGISDSVKEIVSKCDGVPLAIVLIAGILLDRRDKAGWWKEVSGRVYKYLSRDASEGNKLVEMMYEHLPNKLKPCFLYLGVFRQDYEIPVWKLVRLWISEGFIEGGGGKNTLEDIAEQYLGELVQRNLVMVGQLRSNGKIKTCRLHDTLREFCKKEADEENLFQEVNKHDLDLNTYAKCRRLCITDANIVDFMSGPVSGKHVRSFLRFQKETGTVQPKHASLVLKTFKLLKILEGNSLCLDISSPDLSQLVLLKYVTISSDISIIPSTLSGLWNLQTLIVRTTSKTKSLKVEMDLWKLPHFRNFHTNSKAILPSPDTKGQKNEDSVPKTIVQTLCTISTEGCSSKVFDRTPKLRKLGISGDLAKLFESIGDSSDKSKSKFAELQDLENLKLINAEEKSKFLSLPSHTCFPPKLTMLTLTNTRLAWKEMSTLGKLKSLEVLKLKEFAFQGEYWETGAGGFLHLVHLFIGKTDLVSWKVASAKAFPTLNTLKLKGCDKLEELPDALAEIPSLQSLDLDSTNPQVASSARTLQVQKQKQAGQSLRLSVSPPAHLESFRDGSLAVMMA